MNAGIKPGDTPAVPPAGGPYVPPPDAGTPQSPPAPVQPALVEVPPTQARVFTPPPPPAKPAEPPVVPPASTPAPAQGSESLLGAVETLKPSLEALKIPDEAKELYPKEFLSGIVSDSTTLAEAQKRFDTAHQVVKLLQQGAVQKNTEWINQLKQDPEVGKANWEASVDLYRKGVVEEFGANFAKKLSEGKLDAEPDFFKAVVRRMRAKNPKPVVQGEPPAQPDGAPKTTEEFAKKTYAGMEHGYKVAPARKGPGW